MLKLKGDGGSNPPVASFYGRQARWIAPLVLTGWSPLDSSYSSEVQHRHAARIKRERPPYVAILGSNPSGPSITRFCGAVDKRKVSDAQISAARLNVVVWST